MTELLQAEFEDATGTTAPAHAARRCSATSTCSRRPATRRRPASSAGRARCSPSIPSSATQLVEDRSLVPERDRGAAALRVAVTGAGPLRHRGRRALRRRSCPQGSVDGAAHRRRATATSASSPTPTASTSIARSTITSRSATASTSASVPRSARLEGRVALDEVLQRFPSWEVDWDNAVQARTSTVRGWERLPVVTP